MNTLRLMILSVGLVTSGVSFAGGLAAGGAAQAGSGDKGPGNAADERIIRKQAVISASLAEAWHAWTTAEGVTGFGPPQAKIELRVGGAYEWYFVPDAPEGSRGSEGCTVLTYLPMEMLSFTWNAPPSIPKLRNAHAYTHVVVQFEELENERVKVRLAHLVPGKGEDWEKYYNYFDRAWSAVLGSLERKFANRRARTSGAREESKPMKQYVYFCSPVRATFLEDATDEESAIVERHFHYLKDHLAKGQLILAGRCLDGPPGIVVFEAADDGAARKIMQKDPAVQAGVFTAELHPYRVALMRGQAAAP